MKTRAAVTWREGRGWLLALCLAQLAGACAQTTNTGSGETHFLGSCDAGCDVRLECRSNVCTRACSGDDDCAMLSASATCIEHTGDSDKTCDQLCQRDADCRDIGGDLSCVGGACRTRTESDGSGGTPMANPGSTAGEGSAGSARLTCESCGDESCGIKGACSKASACEAEHCGGATLDENGCLRATCKGDGDCAATERCATVPYAPYLGDCVVSANAPSGCACGKILDAGNHGVCGPTTVVGPRGSWQSLTITEDGMPSLMYPTSWTFFPDGSLHKNVSQEAAGEGMPTLSEHQLTALQLAEVVTMVDGPELRQTLTDPDSCGQVEDYSVAVELVLDTGKWKQAVTDCTFSPVTTGRYPFPNLLELAQLY